MKRRRRAKVPVFDAEGYQSNLTDLNGTPLPDLDKVQVVSHRDGTGIGIGIGIGNHRGQISGSASLRKRR